MPRCCSRVHIACILWLTTLTGWTLPTPGHEPKEATRAFPLQIRYQATPIPDRIALTWTGDPARSGQVTWRSSVGGRSSVVEFVAADKLSGNLLSNDIPGRRRNAAVTSLFESNAGPYYVHSAPLDQLQPATTYAYRVGDDNNWSEWFQFRTASTEPEPFTFVYFGDAQNDIRSWWSRVVREAHRQAPRAAFMLHAGDLVNDANQDRDWGEWFEAGGWLHASIPIVATPGNHEYQDGLSRHWRPQFAFPENGPADLEETTYWFDYQGMRMISLNSNERIADQAVWLAEVLAKTPRPRWCVVTFHHPVFSAAVSRDNSELRTAWQPIFDRHGVDLVLQGHDHAYTRSGQGGYQNVAGGVNQQQGHTVYVVSVSGPKMYPLGDTWPAHRSASGVQLYQVIHVANDCLKYEARLASGTLYDAFELHKSTSGQNRLVEFIPDTAEIRE